MPITNRTHYGRQMGEGRKARGLKAAGGGKEYVRLDCTVENQRYSSIKDREVGRADGLAGKIVLCAFQSDACTQ